MFNTPLFFYWNYYTLLLDLGQKKRPCAFKETKIEKKNPEAFLDPFVTLTLDQKKSFSWPLCALIISWLEYSHLDNIISANTTITQPSSYEQPRESCCAHVVQTPCFVVRLGLGRGTVEALIRWATGKRLTDRLPKLSLVTAHNAHVGQITIS